MTTEKKDLKPIENRKPVGKYQRLNELTAMNTSAIKLKTMLDFEEEERMADQIFKVY